MRERISAQVGRWPVLAGVLLWPALAAAQQTTTEAPPAHPVGVLMIFTIGAALAIGIGLLVMFLRKRSNREAMRRLNDE